MSRRLSRISLAIVFLLSSEVWAIGLGDIQLDSALNEPLRAEITLLSATPDELDNLDVTLASSETFDRYGIDRPFYLLEIDFKVVRGADGAVVQVRSRTPMTEPFLTFLVEATWPSGRLLREYTVLLDPPTYAPPAVQQAPAVTAPSRAAPADTGRIERQPPAAQPPAPSATPAPSRPPSQPSRPAEVPSSTPVEDRPYDTSAGGEYVVQRNDTLWGIASRIRPDSRLTMNQTMLAIYEANPEAFGGNINLLRAGAALRLPSAEEMYRISSGTAFSEVKRQNEAWSGGTGYTAPPAETRPSLTLVPPDEEPEGLVYDDELVTAEPLTREEEILNRIDELESADVPDQPSLIEIRDNELATLRQELANIRGEVYEPPVEVPDEAMAEDVDVEPADDEFALDDVIAEPDEPMVDTEAVDDTMVETEAEAEPETEAPSTVVRTTPRSEPGIVDRILGALTSVWAMIAAALVVVLGLLFWFMRRSGGEEAESGPWEALDSDEAAEDQHTATETMQAPTPEEAIVVVEQDSAIRPQTDETVEMPVTADAVAEGTGQFGSLEDTFSSDTAVNLDQTDPIAEADFHMAYGLYDQAADLVNGALETDPDNTGLMSKLCEIYFVWGNRDAFVDAASKLKATSDGGEGGEWDKIVIMGQQIAADHELFAGAGVAGATKAVDLSFEADGGEAGALDMDFGVSGGDSGAIDLGAEEGGDDDEVDFLFDEEAVDDALADDALELDIEPTAESPTIEAEGTLETVEMPAPESTVEAPTIEAEGTLETIEMPAPESTVETPTIEQPVEQPIGDIEGTSELPSLDETLGQEVPESGHDVGETAEINLDDLDLGIDELGETELASLDDIDETGTNEALSDDGFTDTGSITGKNPQVDPNETGVREGPDLGELFDELEPTGEMRLAADETGRSPSLDTLVDTTADTEISLDESLLDATGLTQVLSDEMAVETAADIGAELGDDEATVLAVSGDDSADFDFAKTEALPSEAFESLEADATGEMPTMDAEIDATGDMPSMDIEIDETGDMPSMDIEIDETGAMPAMDLDADDTELDDLTAALKLSEAGDTIDQVRDDATVEQPRPGISGEGVETMSLGPEDMSDDLHEARTMTEVGTKLDLARAYVDMGDPAGARSILEEVLDEGDEGQRQQAQQLLDSLPS